MAASIIFCSFLSCFSCSSSCSLIFSSLAIRSCSLFFNSFSSCISSCSFNLNSSCFALSNSASLNISNSLSRILLVSKFLICCSVSFNFCSSYFNLCCSSFSSIDFLPFCFLASAFLLIFAFLPLLV